MAYQKLQPTQASEIFLSDDINPIDPSRPSNLDGTSSTLLVSNRLVDLSIATNSKSGDATAVLASNLVDSNANFNAAPAVLEGDTVVNTSDGTISIVTGVVSDTQISIGTDLFDAIGETYEIYSGQGFRDKVSIGDLVLNKTTSTLTAVADVMQTQLAFGSNVFPIASTKFKVYDNTAQMNTNTQAFVVYVGAASGASATWAEVKVTTAAGNDITFSHFPTGTFLPVQCLRVWTTGTTATNVVALW